MKAKGIELYGFLLPHPPVLVPPVGAGREREAAATCRAMEEAATRIAGFAPETVVVISPHAPLYRDYVFVYDRDPLAGSFAHFGAPEAARSFRQDTPFVTALLENLKARGLPAGSEASHEGRVLDHGALVPLWFVAAARPDFSLVVLSQSALPETDILAAGECVAETARALGRRTVIVASGDMSHRVNRESPYGMRPEGAVFDKAICDAMAASDPASVRSIDPGVREAAAECGYRSIVMLDGAMPGARTELLSYEAPFGIGYCVAEFRQGAEG